VLVRTASKKALGVEHGQELARDGDESATNPAIWSLTRLSVSLFLQPTVADYVGWETPTNSYR
jgi:hypothetical protein